MRTFWDGDWLTAKRIRAHGLMLAISLWSVFLWNLATPGLLDRGGNLKGTDFLHLYTLGSLAVGHRGADLYNMPAQSQLAAQRVPAAAGIRYLPLYPPQVSIFFAPFARFSYPWALAMWLVMSALTYGACCYAVWRVCPWLHGYGHTVSILAIAYPAFWHLLAWGQTSALALACFTAAFLALRNGRDFLAGLALGCLVFKPQLGLAAAIVFLITLRWRIVAGALLSAAAELAVGASYYGSGSIWEWARALRDVPRELPLFEPKIYQTHCLRTFWDLLIPWPAGSLALYAVSALVVCALMIACWRRPIPLSLRYSVLLLASVLLSPHLTVYDLVILALAFLLMADWVIAQPDNFPAGSFKFLLYFAFVLPLLGPLARWTHLQLSVVVMALLLYGIWRVSKNPGIGVGVGYPRG
jgi:hypothetical protein